MTGTQSTLRLVWPSSRYLPSYVAALERGWAPDNVRGKAAADEQLEEIARDRDAFLRSLVDRKAEGEPITLPDGSQAERLPGYQRWMWDGDFCGAIGLRWQTGTEALPPTCLGHIGYSVVPWKQGRGYATRALHLMLREARAETRLRYVEITTDVGNAASQRVIAKNGGVFVEQFIRPPQCGGTPGIRFRIDLPTSSHDARVSARYAR